MADSRRNAAIWYVEDSYNPDTKGINGRRVAGASFLKGFFDHADVSEFVSITTSSNSAKAFGQLVADHARGIPHREVYQLHANKLGPVGTVYYPGPNCSDLLWKRQSFGARSYSICGITHTTASQAVMRGIHDLRAAPQMEWDAMICTSQAVRAAIIRNMEIADELLKERFGSLPPHPQMPVIPLGIDTAHFSHDQNAGNRLRSRMKWTEKDIVISTISRLLPYGKFDPGPLFISLQRAQEILGEEKHLHFIACGIYLDDHSRQVFESTARLLMPDVSYHHLDGSDPDRCKETLSGSDIFSFMIDNVQETFGLAPIEAMAAGLPVVTSDWDGMRDTVTEDVGIRISTRFVQPEASKREAHTYLCDAIKYHQYGARLSAMTSIDLRSMTEAFVELARNDDLRRRMGMAAEKRAQEVYDWSSVIPLMQDFWAELNEIRTHSKQSVSQANPIAPLPMDLFSSYPDQKSPSQSEKFYPVAANVSLKEVYTTRRIEQLGSPFSQLETLEKVLSTISVQKTDGFSIADIAKELGWNPIPVERSVLFLLKYGFIETSKNQNAELTT